MNLDYDNKDFNQVIEHLPDGKVRVYNIESIHLMTKEDPLTTIRVRGFVDHDNK